MCKSDLNDPRPAPDLASLAAPPRRVAPSADTAPERIDRDRLGTQLGARVRAWPVEIVEQTTSTNADLLEMLRAERALDPQTRGDRRGLTNITADHGTVATQGGGDPAAAFTAGADGLAGPRVKVAYEQTAGRGRRGRNWVARPGDALLFSVGGRLPRGVDGLAGLSLAVGLAVYEAFCQLPVDPARLALKWPNDVLVDGAKVSGILIETASGDARSTSLVVGIGINLRGAATLAASMPAPDPSAAAGTAPPTPPTALDAIWAAPSITDVLAALLTALERTFARFGAEGFAPFRAAWCEADAYRDRPVAIYDGAHVTAQGIGRGVDALGQLLLDTPQGLRAIASGDVSLRPA